jgi:predicted metal-binding membrane protein
MLGAMMPPLLAPQLRHVVARSLTRRRIRAALLFLLGYLLMWLMAGAVLTLGSLLLGSVAIAAAVPRLAAAALIAVFWQATPLKQSSLNRCHGKPPLAAFGLRAEADAFGYGAAHGAWCIGSCWALMLLPLAAGPSLHFPVMAVVMIMLIVERARVPKLVRWGAALPRLPRSSRALFTKMGAAFSQRIYSLESSARTSDRPGASSSDQGSRTCLALARADAFLTRGDKFEAPVPAGATHLSSAGDATQPLRNTDAKVPHGFSLWL